jgi:hypothetical protein
MSFGCLNIGTGFIKFFQVIEILGKFLFLPVTFNNTLRNVLFSINKLGEIVNLDPGLMVKESLEEQFEQNRYWFKLSIFKEYKNVLQSALFQMTTLFTLIALECLFSVLEAAVFSKKQRQDRTTKATKVFGKIISLVEGMKSICLQGMIVDIVFSSTFNLLGSSNI